MVLRSKGAVLSETSVNSSTSLAWGCAAEVVVGMRAQQQQVKLRFNALAEQDRALDMNHGRIGDRTRQQTGENAYGSRMKTANRHHLE